MTHHTALNRVQLLYPLRITIARTGMITTLILSGLLRSYATLPQPMSNLRCPESHRSLFHCAEVMIEPVEYFLEEWHGGKSVPRLQDHVALVCGSSAEQPKERLLRRFKRQ